MAQKPRAQKEAAEETLEVLREAEEQQAAASEDSAEKQDYVGPPRGDDDKSCQVCGEPTVLVQDLRAVSKAQWCATHVPPNLRAAAMEANQTEQFQRQAFGLEHRRQELRDLTVDDLQSLATTLEVRGRSSLNKDDLVEHILRAEIRNQNS